MGLHFNDQLIIQCRKRYQSLKYLLIACIVNGMPVSGLLFHCGLDLTFDLAVVTLTYKILSGLYLVNREVEEVDTSWSDLLLTLPQ